MKAAVVIVVAATALIGCGTEAAVQSQNQRGEVSDVEQACAGTDYQAMLKCAKLLKPYPGLAPNGGTISIAVPRSRSEAIITDAGAQGIEIISVKGIEGSGAVFEYRPTPGTGAAEIDSKVREYARGSKAPQVTEIVVTVTDPERLAALRR